MAHTLLQLSGAYGTDVLAAGSYNAGMIGHLGNIASIRAPICAVSYVSATVKITAATGAGGERIENEFVYGAGTGIVAAEGQMVFCEDVYAFTCDQPVKIWYSR